MTKLRTPSLLLLVCLAFPLQAADPDLSPAGLLGEAFKLERGFTTGPGYGNWRKPLVLLRIGDTMRMHGLTADALAALDECQRVNADQKELAVRDEIAIELCWLFTRMGKADRAQAMLKGITFRSYDAAAAHVIARTLLDMGDPAAAEKAIRESPALTRPPKWKKTRGDGLWLRAMVRLAVQMNKPELARELVAKITYPFWKSAAQADLATVLARDGKPQEAMKAATAIPDAYMATLAHAKLAAALAAAGDDAVLPEALKQLTESAAKLKTADERDFVLRLAVRRLVAAGKVDAAAKVAEQIKTPCEQLLAACELLTPATFDAAAKQIDLCAEADRSLAAEALAIACASKGMAQAALKAAERVAPGWPRLRALCAAAHRLADRKADARALVDAAAKCVEGITDPGWRAIAHARVALHYDLVGNAAAVDTHLRAAQAEAAKVTDAGVRRSVLAQVVEAAAWLKRGTAAKQTVTSALAADDDRKLRDRLVPWLVLAGEPDAAVAECDNAPLRSTAARRAMVYRLARAGRLAHALESVGTLKKQDRAEALADIALAQAKLPAPEPLARKRVGVPVHGSWGSWFPRLERMGVEWEFMPFTMAYEAGAAGLAARYSMLGYPGTGGHMAHVGVAGAEHMREYLYGGGGFVGICAGQFLATGCRFAECGSVYMRGQGPHQVQMRKHTMVDLGLPPVIVIQRRNGGILIPRPGCDIAGWYDTIERYAALVAQSYGFGRVVAFSPHPEGSSGFTPRDRLCVNANNWAIQGLP